MLRTGGFALITVESVVLALAEPPPETPTALTDGECALAASFTVTVMGGWLPPASTTRRSSDVLAAQDHPVPAIDTSVSPDGTVSVTVTVPEVEPAPAP